MRDNVIFLKIIFRLNFFILYHFNTGKLNSGDNVSLVQEDSSSEQIAFPENIGPNEEKKTDARNAASEIDQTPEARIVSYFEYNGTDNRIDTETEGDETVYNERGFDVDVNVQSTNRYDYLNGDGGYDVDGDVGYRIRRLQQHIRQLANNPINNNRNNTNKEKNNSTEKTKSTR